MLKTPIKKMDKSCQMPCLYLFFNVFVYAILVVFIFPCKYLNFSIINHLLIVVWKPAEIAICGIIEVIAITFWLRAIYSNPGVIKKPDDLVFLVSFDF